MNVIDRLNEAIFDLENPANRLAVIERLRATRDALLAGPGPSDSVPTFSPMPTIYCVDGRASISPANFSPLRSGDIPSGPDVEVSAGILVRTTVDSDENVCRVQLTDTGQEIRRPWTADAAIRYLLALPDSIKRNLAISKLVHDYGPFQTLKGLGYAVEWTTVNKTECPCFQDLGSFAKTSKLPLALEIIAHDFNPDLAEPTL